MNADWGYELSAGVIGRIAARRIELGMGCTELARQMTTAGLPFSRSGMWMMENAPRKTISLQELLVFAHVLETSPMDLLWPTEGDVEVVPGIEGDARRVREWTRGSGD